MHEPVKAHVEDYLAGSDRLPREFTAHLMDCDECRQEINALKIQSALFGALRSPEDAEPRAGFYSRVLERIEAQRQSSIWNIFLEPAFGRRLAVASAVFAVLMGLYLVGSEPNGPSPMARGYSSPVSAVTPGEDEPGPVLGGDHDQDQDRGAVLVNLATYQEQ
jgi:hypothetical protein